MDNGARLLTNLNSDVDQLLESSSNTQAATTNSEWFFSPDWHRYLLKPSDLFAQVMKKEDETTDGTDADLLRRRRLAHYESKATSSPSAKDDRSIGDC